MTASIEPVYGPVPFALASPGDCILKSSDGTNFKVFRIVLSLASSVFSDMFDMPQSSATQDGVELPVVDVTETAEILQALLSVIYPSEKPDIRTLPLAFALIKACDKYGIPLDRLAPFAAKVFPYLPKDEAARRDGYALAWRLDYKDVADRLSRHFHGADLHSPVMRNDLVSKAGDPDALFVLWDLYRRREMAMDNFLEGLPLSIFRCTVHSNLTPGEAKRLRINARKSLSTPYPACSDIVQFLNLRDVFGIPSINAISSQGTMPSFSAFSQANVAANIFGAATPAASVAPSTAGGTRPTSAAASSAHTCMDCRNILTQPKVETALQGVQKAVAEFPQTILWPITKQARY